MCWNGAKFVLLLMYVQHVIGLYDISDKILFPNLPNGAPRSENTLCREESQMYIENLNNMTLWAHKMWDSTAKSTNGVLQGSVFQFGNWDECMKVNGPFKTQYCFATMTAKIPEEHAPADQFSLKYYSTDNVLRQLYKTVDISKQSRNVINIGWCTPASCTSKDLEQSLNQYLDTIEHPFYKHNVSYSVHVPSFTCQRENELQIIDSVDIGFCILVAILIILVILGTAYDLRADREFDDKEKNLKETFTQKMISSFSIRQTFLELPKPDESNPSLRLLYGIRTVSIIMIIMDHRFGTFISGPMENFDYIEKEYRSIAAWFLFHGDLFVDTFFILSGILVAYGLLTQLNKRYIHPAFIILIRYVRLTPLYAFVVFFWASMFTHIGSGPFWKIVVPPEVADCRKYWWTNLLYISNYIGGDNMCMTQSWYLPCDFHYFIIAIFIIILMKRNKKMGFALLIGILLLSIIIPFAITVIYLRPAVLHFYPLFLVAPKSHPDFKLTYIKSHTRASTYFLSMFAGYAFYKLKDKEFKFSKLQSHMLTFVSIIFLFVGMASGAIFYNPYHEYNAIEAGVYAGFHRILWGLGTLGMIFTASHGHAKMLYNILSWSPWIPLSKLVYGAYLTHMLFQLRAVGIANAPRHFTYFDTISMALSDVVLSFSLSFLLYIMIENPFRKIIKHLLLPSKPLKINVQNTNETNNVNVCDSRL